MFKLLPPDEKKKVEREYKLRRTIVYLLAMTLVMILGAGAIFPSYIAVVSRAQDLQDRINLLTNSRGSADATALTAWAESIHHKLALLSPTADTDKPYELFVSIINLRPKGIKVDGLAWNKKGPVINVSIAGVASDRQALLDFEQALVNSKKFTNPNFPISNLAKDADIDFQFDLIPAKQ